MCSAHFESEIAGIAQFEPKVVGILCSWCSYAGADKAGLGNMEVPHNFRVVRVMCSGRVEPEFIMQAFMEGADGVAVMGCHTGDCHYKEGNYRALARHRALVQMLSGMGIAPERLMLEFVSASEGERYASLAKEFVERVRALGSRKPASIKV